MDIKAGTLVVVADGRKMLLLRNTGSARAVTLQTLAKSEHANPPTRDQGTDSPGRTQASADPRRSSYDETDWHVQAEEDFAREVASEIERCLSEYPDAELMIVAAPRTLGHLRQHYGSATRNRLSAEVGKDLVDHTIASVAEAITDYAAD